ncbi:putative DNA repair protein [Rosellinia necatrix]|uniref:Putative DNA repair protein n=1 Tax=Rosellinia necatrix TaxID=77044 RepID=A0A1W2TN93_ROSNE|nr:putative DNA repair protein [Rosellinia necatrix]
MPPSTSAKRSRRAAFNEDASANEHTINEVAASSSLRNGTQRKRARLSGGATGRKAHHATNTDGSDDDNGDDDDDDEPMVEAGRGPTPPPATQYELIRDQDFKHLEHTEQDDQRATQRLKERPTIIGDNHAADNAIIESITCINFMCHVKLHVELGPLLNFIVGENGSGKSAVLTAITLCLGGKASATNRGGSLKSFVKEGTEHASLVVRLKNQGEDAYKPDLYGDSIICERWFTKSASSGFKVKSAAGRIISTKKAEVDDIVEWYCLQVDNPLNVLSQDNARQFLNAATPAMKYSYFVKGTQLEQLDDDYKTLTQYLEDQENKLTELEENLAYLKDKFEKAVKLRDAASKSNEMRHRAHVYKDQLAWAQVEEQEEIFKLKEQAIITAQEEITRTQQIIDEKAHVLGSIDTRIQQAEERLHAATGEYADAEDAVTEVKDRFDASRAALTALHTEERDMHTSLSEWSKTVKDVENLIRLEEEKIEGKNGTKVAEKQKELNEARQHVESLNGSIQEHKDVLKTLEEAEKDAIKQLREPTEKAGQKRDEVQQAESALRSLSQRRKDPLDAFDNRIRQLLKLIENDRGFVQKPIGPLGTYIRLTKTQWMHCLEKFFGGSLNGFIVETKQDQARLMAHMDKLRIQGFTVFIGKASINSLREPEPNFDTILRVLKFEDQRVRDHLIINHRIEQTLLIESRSTAENVMFDGPPENSGTCLSFQEKKKDHGLRITNINGNLATTPITPSFSQRPRMKTDQDSEIQYYENRLTQFQAEYRALEALLRNGEQAVQRAKRAIAQHRQRGEQLARELTHALADVSRLLADLDNFEGDSDRLRGFQDTLKEAQEKKDHYGNQYAEVAIKKREMSTGAEALKDELNQAKLASSDYKAQVAKVKDKVARLKETRHLALGEKNMAHENHDVAKVAKTQAEASRDRQAGYVEDYIKHASEIAPTRVHIPEGETYKSIERKYESIREQISKLRQQMGATEEQINTRATQATQEYRDAKDGVKNIRMTSDSLKKALMDRLAKYREFQRHVSAQARCNFGYLLSERGFRGQLLLDHRTRKLDVVVEPDKTRENGRGRNTKTLSGGEKSFSSICLLLAIWDAMGSPLRCLDEFDVFMDNVNRAISTNMLIGAARRSVGKQFLLITPNAIEGRAKLDKDVKIIRLTDPRQQRLPEMMR